MRRLRAQIILAFIVLSVIPLTAIVTFSYYSSERSFRRAVERETSLLASQMDARVDTIAETVGRDMARVGDLPVEAILAGAESGQLPEKFRVVFGENAELLTLDVVPDAPEPPAEAAPESAAGGPEPPAAPRHVTTYTTVTTIARPAAAPTPPVETVPPAPRVARVAPTPEVAVTPPAPPVADLAHLDPAARAEIEKSLAASREQMKVAAAAREQALAELKAHLDERKATRQRERAAEAVIRLQEKALETAIVKDGERIGRLRAQLRGDELVRRVIRGSDSREGDLVFAVDREGTLFASSDEEKAKIEGAGLAAAAREGTKADEDWVVASSPDEATGISFAIARPISESLRDMRASAARNFVFGLGLIGFALIGITPLANHIARDIETVTAAADEIAQGKLDTEVSVTSKNEIGRLATAFNAMARDLRLNQERLLDEERSRREQEIERRLLAAEYERKSAELEEARRFQLSLLPSTPPAHPELDVASYVHTATEVGGDYWDYLLAPDGTLTLVVGDATGHGARAGTMVTVVKSLFATFSPEDSLADFLERANQSIRRMGLERMAMALTLARFRRGALEIAAAGMPPALVHRAATGTIEDVAIEAPPLGTLAFNYTSRSLEVAPGDTVLLMTDGFPELLDSAGDPLGYTEAEKEFAASVHGAPRAILDHLASVAEAWTGGAEPADDITFVAVRVR